MNRLIPVRVSTEPTARVRQLYSRDITNYEIRMQGYVSKDWQLHWLLALLFAALLVLTPNLKAHAAIGHATSASLSPAMSLDALGDVDLLEAAFREGVSYYEDGDYAAAMNAWSGPASNGHARAQFNLGVIYAVGQGTPVNLARAIYWWEEAAEHGHVGAQFNLGLLYAHGQGVDKDISKARDWWQRAADGGDAAAQFQLGVLAATGEGEPQNLLEAAHWWQMSAAQGHEQAVKGLEILRSYGVLSDEASN
ncbi:MAG: sel1 repeat family protein [Gammaproteobacteria bacterium]|nr:sel1 repeat family protein [Gammaproteobacteria bacterium]